MQPAYPRSYLSNNLYLIQCYSINIPPLSIKFNFPEDLIPSLISDVTCIIRLVCFFDMIYKIDISNKDMMLAIIPWAKELAQELRSSKRK